MARLDEIIRVINAELESNLGIQNIKGYGIATTVDKKGQRIPYVMSDKAFEEPVTLDDTYDASFYHMLKSNSSSYDEGFGRDYITTEKYSLSLIFYFKNNHTNIATNFIAEMLKNHIPVRLSKTQRALLSIRSDNVSITGQDTNKDDIYKNEFQGLDNRLDTKSILIRTDYEIEIKFAQSCTDLSLCSSEPGNIIVPCITTRAIYLLAKNNLSDVLDASESRKNLGLEIGVDVQAASIIDDEGLFTWQIKITSQGVVYGEKI